MEVNIDDEAVAVEPLDMLTESSSYSMTFRKIIREEKREPF